MTRRFDKRRKQNDCNRNNQRKLVGYWFEFNHSFMTWIHCIKTNARQLQRTSNNGMSLTKSILRCFKPNSLKQSLFRVKYLFYVPNFLKWNRIKNTNLLELFCEIASKEDITEQMFYKINLWVLQVAKGGLVVWVFR